MDVGCCCFCLWFGVGGRSCFKFVASTVGESLIEPKTPEWPSSRQAAVVGACYRFGYSLPPMKRSGESAQAFVKSR